jgi:hypothetical protein
VPEQCKQANQVRFGFGVFVLLNIVSFIFSIAFTVLYCCYIFVSPYNHLLFLAKTNKENVNNIDFSLSKEHNLKKYSSILD